MEKFLNVVPPESFELVAWLPWVEVFCTILLFAAATFWFLLAAVWLYKDITK